MIHPYPDRMAHSAGAGEKAVKAAAYGVKAPGTAKRPSAVRLARPQAPPGLRMAGRLVGDEQRGDRCGQRERDE
jgi:hypothetical protein